MYHIAHHTTETRVCQASSQARKAALRCQAAVGRRHCPFARFTLCIIAVRVSISLVLLHRLCYNVGIEGVGVSLA